MTGLLESFPPVVQLLVAFALANATAFVGTHYLGLPPVSGGIIVGMGMGVAIGLMVGRRRQRRTVE